MSLYHFTGRCFLNKQIPRQLCKPRQIPHFRGGRFYSYSPTSLMRCDSVRQAEMASAQWRNVAHAVPVSAVPPLTHSTPYPPPDWPSLVSGRWKQWKCCAHLKISQVYLPDIISYKLRKTHSHTHIHKELAYSYRDNRLVFVAVWHIHCLAAWQGWRRRPSCATAAGYSCN